MTEFFTNYADNFWSKGSMFMESLRTLIAWAITIAIIAFTCTVIISIGWGLGQLVKHKIQKEVHRAKSMEYCNKHNMKIIEVGCREDKQCLMDRCIDCIFLTRK